MKTATYTPEETVRLGEERYQQELRSQVEGDPDNRGKILVLDVDTGEYEMDDEEYLAFKRLKARCPAANAYMVRVGYPTAVRIGGTGRIGLATDRR